MWQLDVIRCSARTVQALAVAGDNGEPQRQIGSRRCGVTEGTGTADGASHLPLGSAQTQPGTHCRACASRPGSGSSSRARVIPLPNGPSTCCKSGTLPSRCVQGRERAVALRPGRRVRGYVHSVCTGVVCNCEFVRGVCVCVYFCTCVSVFLCVCVCNVVSIRGYTPAYLRFISWVLKYTFVDAGLCILTTGRLWTRRATAGPSHPRGALSRSPPCVCDAGERREQLGWAR